MTTTASTFATRHDAQEFANLRSLVDGCQVEGPLMHAAGWIVYATVKWEYPAEGGDTCTAMTDASEGVDVCEYGDGVGYCGLIPGHAGKRHLCVCTEHTF